MADSLHVLTDEALLAHQRELVVARRGLDAKLASVAAEIARRSDRSLGFAGLAARLGMRSAEQLIAAEAGLTAREAGSLVRVGSLAEESPVCAAVEHGAVSIAAADAVVRGLGEAAEGVDADALRTATDELLESANGTTPEELAQDARARRAALDRLAVVDRERALRARRSLRVFRQEDGMTRLTALLDPESAALVVATLDAATSPRRGGPRFVDKDEIARAAALHDDPRTTEQLALDVFVELLRLGGGVAPGHLLGIREPAVRVLVTESDLARREGLARIEGQTAPASIATAERHICERGTVPILFDSDGQVINVGREFRRFTARQRIGLAARDGGCRWPGCDRPPSWCEAHHIDEWKAHGGRTDIADGILLCRFHHLFVHDRGWRIQRRGAEYWATPAAESRDSGPRGDAFVRLPTKTRIPVQAS